MDANESNNTESMTTQEAAAQEEAASSAEKNQEQADSFDREYVEKLRKENAKYRTRVKELEPQAAKLKEIEDASKSELEKAQELIKSLQAEKQAAQSQMLRAQVAQSKGVPVHLLPAAGSQEELEEAADKLLEWAGQAKKVPAAPKVDSVGKDTAGMSKDELARSILGFGS